MMYKIQKYIAGDDSTDSGSRSCSNTSCRKVSTTTTTAATTIKNNNTNNIRINQIKLSLIKLNQLSKSFSILLVLLCVIKLNSLNGVYGTAIPTSGGAGGASTVAPSSFSSSVPLTNCSAVNTILLTRGLTNEDLLMEPTKERIPKYCDISMGTCCSYNTELKLAAYSRMQLEKVTKDSIGKLASVLGTKAHKFDDYFKELLAQSKEEFHAMFKRTYGVIYEQNAYVFSDLFKELERYYVKGDVDLTEALDSFFNRLYQKIFTVFHSHYNFDDNYLGCISENMKELKPFGDVPHKLSSQVKRSFVAIRTYSLAVNVAADVAKSMVNIRLSPECTAAITKLNQCGVCNGYVEKPCANFCSNVMKGCLSHFKEFETQWDNFVDAIDKLSERLLGPFNIVMVVNPMHIKISEAIMNFQETATEITTQTFQGCGKPELGRRRRSTMQNDFFTDDSENDGSFVFEDDENSAMIEPADEIKSISKRSPDASGANHEIDPYEPVKFSNDDFNNGGGGNNKGKKNKKNKNKKNFNMDDDYDSSYEPREPVLDKLVKDIRQRVRDSKKFWSNLPYQLCNMDVSSLPSNEGSCWNGRNNEGYSNTAGNLYLPPEFPMPPTISNKQNTIIANKLFALKTSIENLRLAHQGSDVEWSDQEEGPEYGSGSGSGTSSEDTDEIGSGIGPFEVEPTIPRINPQDHSTPHTSSTGNTDITVDPTTTNMTETTENDVITHKTVTITDNNTISKAPNNNMSMHRALFTYLFPIFMAWFGGCFSDLL